MSLKLSGPQNPHLYSGCEKVVAPTWAWNTLTALESLLSFPPALLQVCHIFMFP